MTKAIGLFLAWVLVIFITLFALLVAIFKGKTWFFTFLENFKNKAEELKAAKNG